MFGTFQLPCQQTASEVKVCNRISRPRLYSTASPQGSNPVHEIGEKGKPGLPTWGYVAIGAGVGGVYYMYNNRQKVDAESAPRVGGDHYTSPKSTTESDAVNVVSPPVKVPPFKGLDPVQGTPLSLDDLMGDFAVVVTVDAKDPEVAEQILGRLLQVIEGIDQKSNMQYTIPLVVDHGGDQKASSKETGGKLKQLINEFMDKVKSKKNKTEARFKGLAGEEATKSIKEALAASTSKAGGVEGDKKPEQAPSQPQEVLAVYNTGNMHLITPEGTIVITYEEEAVPEEIASNAAEQILDYKRSHPDWHGTKSAKGRTA